MKKEKFLQHAKEGNIEEIMTLVEEEEDEGERDMLAYQWLSIAADFGHEEAEEIIEQLMEVASLRYWDNGEFQVAHFEIGQWYIDGKYNLPRDIEKALQHFREAEGLEQFVTGYEDDIETIRTQLRGEDLSLFNTIFSAN